MTMVRIQLGWLDEHPIRLACGTCKINISGTAFLNQDEGTAHVEFINATLVHDEPPQFYVEASGELLTEKLKVYDDGGQPYFPAPFFSTFWEMGGEGFQEFKRRTLQFLHFLKHEWNKVRRINDLLVASDFKRVSVELDGVQPGKRTPGTQQLQLRQRVRHLNMAFLQPVADNHTIESFRFVGRRVEILVADKRAELQDLLDYFASGPMANLEGRFIDWMSRFAGVFEFLIPVFGLRFYEDRAEDLFDRKGTTSASLDDIKEFYIDSFEFGMDLAELVVAYNNLEVRGDYRIMSTARKDVKNLKDWIKLSKGSRLDYLDTGEPYDRLVDGHLNNRLRNAVAHDSCKFDGNAQTITYKVGKSVRPETMHFVAFLEETWEQAMRVVAMSELLYRTRVLYELSTGKKPLSPSFYRRAKSRKTTPVAPQRTR